MTGDGARVGVAVAEGAGRRRGFVNTIVGPVGVFIVLHVVVANRASSEINGAQLAIAVPQDGVLGVARRQRDGQ